ncbi:MAG: restriction endonuclease subunit S, partial [Bacilli bacterium]|nr:restriction endonuclease subunit S [Bacilli bacterium]
LLNPMDLYSGANCSLSEVEGVISPAYVNLRASVSLNSKFFDYYFKTQYWTMAMFAHGKGVSFDNRWTINTDGVLNYELPFPNPERQAAIVDCLKKKGDEIDSLIAVEEAQIEAIKEYRYSVISTVVSNGLHGESKNTKSGEWFDLMPSHWKASQIKRLVDKSHRYPIGDGDHGLIKTEDYVDEGIPFIRVLNLTWGEGLNTEKMVYITQEKNEKIKSSTLLPGDLLIAKTGATIGKTAIVPEWMEIANTTSHVGKITISKEHCAEFYFYVLNSFIVRKQVMDISIMQTTRPELGNEGLKSLIVPVPPLDEQIEIANYLRDKCEEMNTLLAIKQRKIDLLIQYKRSLIYEYVTGKKEVAA